MRPALGVPRDSGPTRTSTPSFPRCGTPLSKSSNTGEPLQLSRPDSPIHPRKETSGSRVSCGILLTYWREAVALQAVRLVPPLT